MEISPRLTRWINREFPKGSAEKVLIQLCELPRRSDRWPKPRANPGFAGDPKGRRLVQVPAMAHSCQVGLERRPRWRGPGRRRLVKSPRRRAGDQRIGAAIDRTLLGTTARSAAMRTRWASSPNVSPPSRHASTRARSDRRLAEQSTHASDTHPGRSGHPTAGS